VISVTDPYGRILGFLDRYSDYNGLKLLVASGTGTAILRSWLLSKTNATICT
jgi:hypothetical protein